MILNSAGNGIMREFFSSQYGQLILVTLAVIVSGAAGVVIALWSRW